MNHVVEDPRVHHDVPVAGYEKVGLARRQRFQTFHGQLDDGLLDEARHVPFQEQLNVVDRDQPARPASEVRSDQAAGQARPGPGEPGREEDGHRTLQLCVLHQARNYARDLPILVRSNAVKVEHGGN